MIANRGTGVYLLDVGDGLGRVYNAADESLTGPAPIAAIAARGYWNNDDGQSESATAALVRARALAAESEPEPWSAPVPRAAGGTGKAPPPPE